MDAKDIDKLIAEYEKLRELMRDMLENCKRCKEQYEELIRNLSNQGGK